MSVENEPRYQSPKTNQQKQRNPAKRPKETTEQQRVEERSLRGAIQKQIEQERKDINQELKELMTLVSSKLSEAKKERHSSVRLTSQDGTRIYEIRQLSANNIRLAVSIVIDSKAEKIIIVRKSYIMNAKDITKNRQKMVMGMYNATLRKIISVKDVDPVKDRGAYTFFNRTLPSLEQVQKDIEKNIR